MPQQINNHGNQIIFHSKPSEKKKAKRCEANPSKSWSKALGPVFLQGFWVENGQEKLPLSSQGDPKKLTGKEVLGCLAARENQTEG